MSHGLEQRFNALPNEEITERERLEDAIISANEQPELRVDERAKNYVTRSEILKAKSQSTERLSICCEIANDGIAP